MRDVTVYLVSGGEIICQDVRAGVVKLLEERGARTNRVDFRAKPKRIRVPVSGEIIKNTSQAQSIVCQAIGQLAEEPCKHCKDENGPYTTCKFLPQIMHGACANCHWSAAGDRCSIRDDARKYLYQFG